jgi:hypothetical protein
MTAGADDIGREPIAEFFQIWSSWELSRLTLERGGRVRLVWEAAVAAIKTGKCACASCGAALVVEDDTATYVVALSGQMIVRFPFCGRCSTSNGAVWSLAQREFSACYHHWGQRWPASISGSRMAIRTVCSDRRSDRRGTVITVVWRDDR